MLFLFLCCLLVVFFVVVIVLHLCAIRNVIIFLNVFTVF